jgi:hypothetical protein
VAEVAEAVGHAHGRGVVHRDLKPSNILVDTEGHAHVIDFGLARLLSGGESLTATGVVVGSPSYLSPEQAAGERELTPASDVFSLGVILYELMTGQLPFAADSPWAALRQTRWAEPQPPRELFPSVPPALEEVCLRCLRKAPSERYPTAAELAEDLRHVLGGQPLAVRAYGKPWKWSSLVPRRRELAVALGLFLALFLLFRAWMSSPNECRAEEARRLLGQYEQDMRDAEAAVEETNFGRAVALVEKHHPVESRYDYRTREWAHLHELPTRLRGLGWRFTVAAPPGKVRSDRDRLVLPFVEPFVEWSQDGTRLFCTWGKVYDGRSRAALDASIPAALTEREGKWAPVEHLPCYGEIVRRSKEIPLAEERLKKYAPTMARLESAGVKVTRPRTENGRPVFAVWRKLSPDGTRVLIGGRGLGNGYFPYSPTQKYWNVWDAGGGMMK